MRLTDTFIIQNLKILSESKSDGLMKISGKFQHADEENNNKRIYPKSLLEREVAKLQESINGQRLLGELDHPEYDSVKLSNVSHKITGLKMKGNEVIGEAVLLNTPAGQVAQQLIKGGVAVGISSRGMGTLSEIDEGRKQVNEDFNLVTFDLVADPSTKGAYPSLTESTVIQKIVVDTSKKIEEEALLLNLLKKKFDNIFEDQEVFNFEKLRVQGKNRKLKSGDWNPDNKGYVDGNDTDQNVQIRTRSKPNRHDRSRGGEKLATTGRAEANFNAAQDSTSNRNNPLKQNAHRKRWARANPLAAARLMARLRDMGG